MKFIDKLFTDKYGMEIFRAKLYVRKHLLVTNIPIGKLVDSVI